ncbi:MULTISPECIES: DUF1659 domain-containing protein [Sporosarcina]|uniref:DUF1659 domain-containing protein n=1 Tax=Sporosarcina TaxID=1569 RepID=UPI000590353C|nr:MULTISPECIES: DUF1659 domain-containing protein [Sporosarcina]WJY28321.1 DUF1659 domain-containing protein [Sporosarcina sp. 0.2-SM1T-5]
MAALQFQTATGKIIFDAGQTPDGRLISRTKTYRFVERNASPESLQAALTALGQLSAWSVMSYEKVVTSTVTD